MKKLSGENTIFCKTSFKNRFCVLDLLKMHFKYAESPKEKLKVFQIDEIEYA